MLKRIKVRGKLLLLIVTPLLAVAVFAFSGVSDRRDQASFQEREVRIAELADAGSDLSLAIQVERLRTLQAGRLNMNLSETLAPERAETNAQLDRWLVAVEHARGDLDDPEFLGDIDFMVERLPANLTDDRNAGDEMAALTSFLQLASRSVDEITAGLRDHAADLDLFQALTDHNRLQAIQSAYVDVTSVGADALETGELAIVSATLLEAAERRVASNIEAFNETASEEHVAALQDLQSTGVLPSPASANAHPVREVQSYLDSPDLGFLEWIVKGEERLVALNGLIDGLLEDAATAARLEADAANEEAQSFLVLAGSVVLLALVMALLVGRSISRPLIRLTRNAEHLSTDELPALVDSLRSARRDEAPVLTPIEVKGRDEVAQLAHAISEIQQVTMDVAEEQGDLLRRGISDIFVNLARRNQSLLDRQIDFIDQLEAREENPDALENLFRLDHLATRMRRNAESLLVLAGAEPTRRRGRPVEIEDVLRVAMGEIEDYGRIRLVSVDGATVAGSVAVDLAHLLSELMENATQFSPPEFMVDVVGALDETGSYRLTLTDRGIGMSAEQLQTANETLAEPPIVGLDLSRSLGFTVVSRLAHRLGIKVTLLAGNDSGVAAMLSIPAEMIGSVETHGDLPDVRDEESAVPDLGPDRVEEQHVFEPSPPPAVADVPASRETPFEPSTSEPAEPRVERPDPVRTPLPAVLEPPAPAPAEPSPPPTPVAASEPPTLPQRRPRPSDAAPTPPLVPPVAPATAPVNPTDTEPSSPPRHQGDLFAVFGSETGPPHAPADPTGDLFAPLGTPAPSSPPPPPEPTGSGTAPPPLPSRRPAGPATPPPVERADSSLPPPPATGLPGEPAPPSPPGSGHEQVAVTVPEGADVTPAGLARRTPRRIDVPEDSRYQPAVAPEQPSSAAVGTPTASRSPEEVRQMLSRYRAGLRKGRGPDSEQTNEK